MYTDIARDQSGLNRGYFVYLQNNKFLHVDLVIRRGILFQEKEMGFYKTRMLAEEAVRQYVAKEQLQG